jgi:Xylanase inhibitor C-terminal
MFHYVNFTGLSLGGKHIDIPSGAYLPQPDGTGGMVLSSTSTYTYLESSAYSALRAAFINQMSSLSLVDGSIYGLDLCFAVPTGKQVTIPQLTLHLNGANMNPMVSSYFEISSDKTVGCLLVLPIQGISILGYMMQYETHMIYDVSNGLLQFESIKCSLL